MGFLKKHPAMVLGLALTLLFLWFSLFRVFFLDTLDLKVYDLLMGLRSQPGTQSNIVLVDIDDDSIEKLGRWPWKRSLLADGIRKINSGNPRVIGLDFILSEPDKNAGLDELQNLQNIFAATLLPSTGEQGAQFLAALQKARVQLDTDRLLAKTLADAGNIVLPVFFKSFGVASESTADNDPFLVKQSIESVMVPEEALYPQSSEIIAPIPAFLQAARGIGHINLAYDMDGTARREFPLYEYNGLYIPSFTLKLAALYLNTPNEKIRAEMGSHIELGRLHIPMTLDSEFLVNFKGSRGSFKNYSFFDVINDKVPASVFKNKLVLVIASASGIMNPLSTPTDPSMPVGEFSANTIWSILSGRFVRQPAWGGLLELLLIFVLGLLITFLFPRLRAMTAGVLFVVLFSCFGIGISYLFVSKGVWLRLTYPLLLLVTGYIGVTSLKYFATEARKDKVEGESAETNRQLGVSFQSQGMLDMAFDKFRRVPVDDEMKDLLYNLALDYERKRQLNKAAAVYQYIEQHDAGFRDAGEKKLKLMQASDTMVFGDGFLGGGAGGKDMLATGTGTRPTLGRYEIIRQLGKGAMGIVYLGQDPRINRTTAIKTFSFGDDFKPEESQKLKEKFFREAESAGTLSHPNIVTIYDAGDEHDLAYIAMEYLEGEDLEKYTDRKNLLPQLKVIQYIADIADALHYAHERGIVHRDIKPANIMLLKSGIIKITDFGIARITASSQTATGVVKGTPYYMSPEQFSGEKVDGRSDIFSLGTMMYQMLTGTLPFRGDNPAALMNRIMNVPHDDPRKINPKIVKPVVSILNKALQKNKENRYTQAILMSQHLREVHKRLEIRMAQRNESGEK